jgi:F0F1-type ATP synthase delta subunit
VANIIDKQIAVARVWARALHVLAAEAGRDDEICAELEELVALAEAVPSLRECSTVRWSATREGR